MMRYRLKILSCVLLAAAVGGAHSRANVPERSPNDYEEIPRQNIFRLKAPDPPPKTEPEQPPRPKVILTGITTILENKRALMKVEPLPGKPGQDTKERSLILTEGQRDGDVEVLQIDDKAGAVKINHAGEVMTLTFDKDGPKLPNSPASAPGATAQNPVGIPVANATPPQPAPAMPPQPPLPAYTNKGTLTMPARIPRLPAGRRGTTADTAAALPTAPSSANGTALATTAEPTLPDDLSPQEKAILLDLQRASGVVSPVAPEAAATNAAPLSPTGYLPGRPPAPQGTGRPIFPQ